MKTLCCVLLSVAALCATGNPSAAKPEAYILGGPVIANLGEDGVQFGRNLAASLSLATSGDWRSEKTSQIGPDCAFGIHTLQDRLIGGALEARFVQRGARYRLRDASGTFADATARLKLNYFEFPMLLELTPRTGGAAQPMFQVGPVISINTSATRIVERGGQSERTGIGGFVRDSHVDAMVGAGLRVRTLQGSAMLFSARYSVDLGSLFTGGADYDLRSRDLSLLVGYAFGL